jgi:hypothetical protein
MAQPAALILLGDRIRADRLRGVLLPVSMAVWVFLYVGMILGRVPSPNPVLLRHPAYASWFWLSRLWFGSFVFAPLITIALWALLVWRQTARSEKALSAA